MVKLSYHEGSDLPPGEYDAVVGKITIKTSREGGDFLAWPFWIKRDGKDEPIDASSSMSTSTKSKAYGWIKAIVGTPPVGQEIDLDALEGLPCRIIVEINPEGWPKVVTVLADRQHNMSAPAAPVAAPVTPTEAPASAPAPRQAPARRQAPTLEPF